MRIVVSAPALAVAAALQRDDAAVVPIVLADLAAAIDAHVNTVYRALRELAELGALTLRHDESDGRRPLTEAVLNRDHWLFAATRQLGGAR